MAWKKESTAARRARVAKQLRDKHGKWIEMGGGVKWFKNGSWHKGTASAFKGNNVVVKMDDGSEQLVNHREIEPIRAKASLKPAKPTGSVQAKKSPGKAAKESVIVKDNDPDKRLTSNASDLEEGDEVYAGAESYSKRFSMGNKEAEKNEEEGFKVRLDKNGEPERARVVDTSGDRVVLEDSRGTRHEIPKTDNVLIDDEEMDAALQNAEDNSEIPVDVDDFDVKSVDPKELGIPEGAIAAYNKGVAASKGYDMDKAEKNFEDKNGKEFSDDFSLGWLDGPHIRDKARDKFQGLYHKYARQNAGKNSEGLTKDDTHLPLDGLDLSDEDKKRINEAKTGEEALKALQDSDAGEYLPIARQNKNKEFVDAYRKAVNDINDKHKLVEKPEAPKAETAKPKGTPVEAIEKSVANLSEDLKEIDANELDGDAEASALADAAYDIRNENGEEFNLTGSRNEDGEWQVDVADSNGNVIDSLNPKEQGSSQKLAQAIKDRIDSNQSSKESDAPGEEPVASEEASSDPRISKVDDNGDIHLAEGENFQSLEDEEDADGNELPELNPEGKVFREDGYYLDKPQDSDSDGADLYSPDGERIAAIFGEGLSADADSIANQHKEGKDISGLPAVKRAKGGEDSEESSSSSDSRISKVDENGDIHLAKGENFQSLDIEDEDEDGNELEPIEAQGKVFREDGYYLDKPEDANSDGADLYSPEGERIASILGEGLTSDADSIADKHKAGEDISELPAVQRAKSSADSEESSTGLDALEKAGFSKEDIDKIASAKDETEARKEFFQSESGKKALQESIARQRRELDDSATEEDSKNDEAYVEATKAFEDFVQGNFQTGKSDADEKLAKDIADREKLDAEYTPDGLEARAQRDRELRENADSVEAQKAKLDRQIAGAEKMIAESKDEKFKEKAKAELEKFKAKKAELENSAESEASTAPSQGDDYTFPEDGVTPLKAKLMNTEQKTIEYLKPGDKFLGEKSETGLKPLGATKTRAIPDGNVWEVTKNERSGIGGRESTITAKNSSGEEASFTVGVGDRKSKVVLDTPSGRERLGIGSKQQEDSSETVEAARAEANADIKSGLDEGQSWEDQRDFTWPIEDSDGEYIAVGAQSSEDDKFLGHFNKDDEELNTFPFEGGNSDREQSDAESESGVGESDGAGDSDSGRRDVSESDERTDDIDDETSSRRELVEVSQEEYDEKTREFLKDDKGESSEDGARVEFSDGYALEKEDQGDGRYKIRLKDSDDKSVGAFWPQRIEDNFPERLKKLSDSHKKMRRLENSSDDSEDRRNLDISNDDKRMASIGTQFSDDDGNTYTKINSTSWASHLNDKDSDLAEVSQFNPEGKKWNYSHDINDRKEKNVENLSDDELRQKISEFDKNIRDAVRREGELMDADRYGKRVTHEMNDEHQRRGYEAYALHKGAEDLTNELWNRLKDSDNSDKSAIDTGDFNPGNGSELPHTDDRGTLDSNVALKLRNEYVGIDSKTVAMNSELRNSDKPSRAAKAWGTKMDKWANSGELADDYELFRSVLASPDRAAEYKPGALIEDKGIMSVGDNMETAIRYLAARKRRTAGKVPVLMTIEGRKGTPMVAAEGGSEELVVPRGAKLFIASAKDDENGIRHVRAVLNPSDAEIAEWTGKKSDANSEAPEADMEAPKTPDVETPTTPEAEAPATPEAKPGFKQVEGFAVGDRVFHPKHGAGEIVRRESNGQYARIKFDDSGKIMGISLTKVTPGDSAPDTPTKTVTPKAPKAPRAVAPKEGSTAERDGWQIGEEVSHAKHGKGKIARLEGNGEYARVQFENLPEGTLKGIKLSQLGRNGEAKTTPAVSEIGDWKVDGRVSHKGNKGEGTIKQLGKDGTFALIEFDNEPGVLRGIRFSRLNNGSEGFEDPDTKVDSKRKKSEKSNIEDPATKVEDSKTGQNEEDASEPKLYVGAIIVHAQLGRGRVVKVGSGPDPEIQIIFDNDPTGKPRSLASARLKDIAIEPKSKSKPSL